MQQTVGILKHEGNFGLGASSFGGIGDAPMRRRRLSRPYRAQFACGVVANSENKIECGEPGLANSPPELGQKV
jgi:hypothetical protein